MRRIFNIPGIYHKFLPGFLPTTLVLALFSGAGTVALGQETTVQDDTVAQSTTDSGEFLPFSTLLTIEQEQLYHRSQLGIALEAMLTAERTKLQSENQAIFNDLSTEEAKLVTLRAETTPEAFSILASAFDDKVQMIRAQQDQKLRDLVRQREDMQQRFMNLVVPLAAQTARARGGLAVIERGSVFLAVQDIDITADAIRLINENYPEGRIPDMFLIDGGGENGSNLVQE